MKVIGGGLIRIHGEEHDGNFADSVFIRVVAQNILTYNILIITQDTNLTIDILNFKNLRSVNASKKLKVFKISKKGILINNKDVIFNKVEKKYCIKDRDQEFKKSKVITDIPDTPIKILTKVKEKYTVFDKDKNKIKLLDKVASGGEGYIFTTDTHLVAKIYKNEKLTLQKLKKLELMISKDIKIDGVCFPKKFLYSQNGEFIGYLMEQARGIELQKCVFFPQLLRQKFPHWTRLDLIELCLSILDRIRQLHACNIILGDINPNNILVVSPTEVYFVDTDSYQVEEFPCPVGTINYTASEIQGKHYSKFLRTTGNENFAIATLLFMIMLPGKPPYSQCDGADQATNIRNGDFSYPLGENKNGKTPDGPWRFMWSHMNFKVKEKFYKTFKKGEMFFEENKRPSVLQWIETFKFYKKWLENNVGGDEMSLDIFPIRFKKVKSLEYKFCRECGVEKPVDNMVHWDDSLCWLCFNKKKR